MVRSKFVEEMDAAAKQFEGFQEKLKEHEGKIRRRGDCILHLEGALEKAEGTIAFMQGQVWVESIGINQYLRRITDCVIGGFL